MHVTMDLVLCISKYENETLAILTEIRHIIQGRIVSCPMSNKVMINNECDKKINIRDKL